MKTLTEIESMCRRILGVLEHDDLRSGSTVALASMSSRLRDDLKRHLADWRTKEGDSPELHAAEDALGTMNNDVLWLREYAGFKPVVEVSQKLRMTTLRALRVVALLQDLRTVTVSGSPSSVLSRRTATEHLAVRAQPAVRRVTMPGPLTGPQLLARSHCRGPPTLAQSFVR